MSEQDLILRNKIERGRWVDEVDFDVIFKNFSINTSIAFEPFKIPVFCPKMLNDRKNLHELRSIGQPKLQSEKKYLLHPQNCVAISYLQFDKAFIYNIYPRNILVR